MVLGNGGLGNGSILVMLEVQSYPSLPRCSSEDNLLGYLGYLYEEIYPQTGESFGGDIPQTGSKTNMLW